MKLKIWFILLWISTFAQAQDAAQCMAFARAQVVAGNDSLAFKMYHRVLFFDKKTYGLECYEALGNILFRLGDYEKSAFYHDLFYQRARTDSLRALAVLGKCSALLLQQKYKEVTVELLNYPDVGPASFAARRQLFYAAALYGDGDFDAAETAFLVLLPSDSSQQRAELSRLIRKAKYYDRKNPKTARILSMIVPGAGQLYAGDFRNGLNSAAINGLTIWWLVYAAGRSALPDALFSIGPVVFRYYSGGYQRAGQITTARKQENLKKNMSQILRLLQ